MKPMNLSEYVGGLLVVVVFFCLVGLVLGIIIFFMISTHINKHAPKTYGWVFQSLWWGLRLPQPQRLWKVSANKTYGDALLVLLWQWILITNENFSGDTLGEKDYFEYCFPKNCQSFYLLAKFWFPVTLNLCNINKASVLFPSFFSLVWDVKTGAESD